MEKNSLRVLSEKKKKKNNESNKRFTEKKNKIKTYILNGKYY